MYCQAICVGCKIWGLISLPQNVQTSSWDQPTSYAVGTSGPFPGGAKWLGHKFDHLTLCSAEDENEWSYMSFRNIVEH